MDQPKLLVPSAEAIINLCHVCCSKYLVYLYQLGHNTHHCVFQMSVQTVRGGEKKKIKQTAHLGSRKKT